MSGKSISSAKRRKYSTRAASGKRVVTGATDRKSTRLNSSHLGISYAVFCLKKKKKTRQSKTRCTHNTTGATTPRSRRTPSPHRLCEPTHNAGSHRVGRQRVQSPPTTNKTHS